MKHLKFKLCFLLLFVSFSWSGNQLVAQKKLSVSDIDRLTFDYYTNKNWDQLIQLGKKSFKNNIDFYYLQYRMGIAYYAKRNYRKAIPYFVKIINTTPEDAIAKEYLYYSYLFSLQIEDARKVLATLDEKQRKKVRFYKSEEIFNNVTLSYKNMQFDDYAINNSVVNNLTQTTRNSLSFYSVNLLSYIANSSVINFNISLLSGDNSVYNVAFSPDIIEEKMKQYQLYFSWKKNIGKGTNLKLGFNYIHETLHWYNSQQTLNIGNNNSSFSTLFYSDTFRNYASYVAFSKSIKNIDFTLASSFSKINFLYIRKH